MSSIFGSSGVLGFSTEFVHGIGDRRQPAVGLHRLRIVERRARHRRPAVFPGELELGLARGEPFQELHRAFGILGAGGDAGDEGADGRPRLHLLRRRGHVDLAHDLGRGGIVDPLGQARVLGQRRAFALEHQLHFLVGVVFRHALGHIGNEAEQAGERAHAFRPGEARRPVVVDEIAAIGIQQRQIGLHDRIALHAAGRPAVHVRRFGRLRHGVDVVPGHGRRREMILVVVEDLDVIDDDQRIELGLRAGEVLHARRRTSAATCPSRDPRAGCPDWP